MEKIQQDLSSLRRKPLIKFCILLLGMFLNFAGYLAVFGLQSSINIEEGVGVASGTTTYATAAVFGVTITPVLLRWLRPKKCIILCELTYLTYILSNLYPAWYTLIPASAIVGVGEATTWPAIMLLCIYYARCFARYSSKESEAVVVEFMGIFFFCFHISGAFGSLLSYAILNRQTSPIHLASNNTTSATPILRDLSVCGRNDCQDPNITSANIDTYVPADKALVYIMIGVLASLVLLAMFIHGIFVKDVRYILRNMEPNDIPDEKLNEEQTEEVMYAPKSTTSTLKQVALQLINPKGLLLAPFALYVGLIVGFAYVELPRAFGSCIVGVETVGLLLAMFRGTDALTSFVSSRINSRIGRHWPMLLAVCMDIVFSLTILFWIPDHPTTWVVYILFISYGILDGFWQPMTTEMFTSYFPGSEDIALTFWTMFVIVGIAWQTGWSTSLCVYQKIYFQISWLCFSLICYGISQFVYYRKTPKKMKENEDCNRKMLAQRS